MLGVLVEMPQIGELLSSYSSRGPETEVILAYLSIDLANEMDEPEPTAADWAEVLNWIDQSHDGSAFSHLVPKKTHKPALSFHGASAVADLLMEEVERFEEKSAEDWAIRIAARATELDGRRRTCSASQARQTNAFRRKMGQGPSAKHPKKIRDEQLIARVQAERTKLLTKRQVADRELSPLDARPGITRNLKSRTSA